MGIGHWFLFDWRIVGWCATPHTENLVAQIEEVLQEAGLVCDMAREECGLGAAAYRGQLYRDADDTTVVQLQAVWEGDGRWALHALQFFRSPWSSTSKSLALATALQPLQPSPHPHRR
ncbi:hypothetical protein [Thermorudis peleae]|uniref:hypothetical protein n=1 Tax=Thermorudis peleae TaxID=1382356 RepID=UPI00056F9503|nr:hypothetical protein [Thermorudis peleae]